MVTYCKNCVAPSINPITLTVEEEGLCSACRNNKNKISIDWKEREILFKELVDEYRSEDNYDCIIPVSGGKDSYFAAHIAKKFNLKALLVTYHSGTYLEEGEYNLKRMKEIFGFDHIIFYPNFDVLRKLHRVGFIKTGDMNWHNHAGIFTFPVQIAVKYKIPLILWGDHGRTEMAGMYSHNDFIEFTAKDRYEHALHGYDWFDFVGEEGLTKKDLSVYIYPDDEDIYEVGVRGIYLSNYFYYDGNHNANIAMKEYGWKPYSKGFERTYRNISNVDDMFENGVHDYMKYIKFGYGRATDHACYDIRLGKMSRQEGIEMVRKYDHIEPSDLNFWLEFVGMSKEEFYEIADKFRDERVWKKVNGKWIKKNIWDLNK
jgi:N-acetyl sugar amidotransferase